MQIQTLVVNKYGSVWVSDVRTIIRCSNQKAGIEYTYGRIAEKLRKMSGILQPDRIYANRLYAEYLYDKSCKEQEEKKQMMLNKAKPLKYRLKSSKERKKAAQTKWPSGYVK